MNTKYFGILVGLILGIAYVLRGTSGFLEVGVLGMVGYVVTKVAEGELDPLEFLETRRRR